VKVEMSDHSPRLDPVCGLGEHSRAILEELGYDDDAIGDLVARGVVVDGSAVASVEASR
jgi:crotonobetainyl-CoA:carnitine CoA-transferase CaiB-like acyl-CoA transferase